jgi:O-antigen ligase
LPLNRPQPVSAQQIREVLLKFGRSGGLFRDRSETSFWVLAVWLALVFLLGGSSRADVQTLLFLRPASALVLCYGLSSLTALQLKEHRGLFVFAAMLFVLLAAQLVPLPPGVWQQLPGREILAQIDRAAGNADLWRPLTMAPAGTRNALWSLTTPLGVLVLAVQLDAKARARLLHVLLVLGLFSAVMGVLQMLGGPDGPLYPYRYSHFGLPVGLFANRNHQAVFMVAMLPMLLVWWRQQSTRPSQSGAYGHWSFYGALCAGALILPLILVTGSRSGMTIALVVLLALPLMLLGDRGRDRPSPGKPPRRMLATWSKLALPVIIAILVTATIINGQAHSVDRLFGQRVGDDIRVAALPTILAMANRYAPWGSGFGSFERVYQIDEPNALLTPNYLNHAHNDWLELVLTGGLPALVLVLIVAATVAIGAFRAWKTAQPGPAALHARLGIFVILIFAIASITDYPLRVPSLMCLMVLAVLWSKAEGEAAETRAGAAAGADNG